MNGCNQCPAYAKCTVSYRGSACAALRSTYGLDTDPEIKTNADRIRDMSDENLAYFLAYSWATSARAWQKNYGETLRWLQQTKKEDDHGSTDI